MSLRLFRKIFCEVPWPDRAAESGVKSDSAFRSAPALSGRERAKGAGAQPDHRRRQCHPLSDFAPVGRSVPVAVLIQAITK